MHRYQVWTMNHNDPFEFDADGYDLNLTSSTYEFYKVVIDEYSGESFNKIKKEFPLVNVSCIETIH